MKDSECATSSAHMCFPTVNIEKNEIEKLNFLQLVDTRQYFRHPGTTAISPIERLGLKQKNPPMARIGTVFRGWTAARKLFLQCSN